MQHRQQTPVRSPMARAGASISSAERPAEEPRVTATWVAATLASDMALEAASSRSGALEAANFAAPVTITPPTTLAAATPSRVSVLTRSTCSLSRPAASAALPSRAAAASLPGSHGGGGGRRGGGGGAKTATAAGAMTTAPVAMAALSTPHCWSACHGVALVSTDFLALPPPTPPRKVEPKVMALPCSSPA